MSQWEAVIGLEVHAQLMTQSKLFCFAQLNNDSIENNEFVDVVSAGLPGALPVLNRHALELAVRAGLVCQCQIENRSLFERKNYFYADLPKGYQISQLSHPLCTNGKIEISSSTGGKKAVRIFRIQMEEDAGQLLHIAQSTLVDLNRAGTPLVEIVSAPDISTAQEAKEYLKRLHSLLVHAEVSDGNLESGNFRCDANVSIRKVGEKELGVRTEIKNLNSFRFVEAAIEYEISRQIALCEAGGSVQQETRGWDAAGAKTFMMRRKEDADDYRYFPDPDLPWVCISDEEINKIKAEMPELPDAKAERLSREWGLSVGDVEVLLVNRAAYQYVDGLVAVGVRPSLAASWVLTDLLGLAKAKGVGIDGVPIGFAQMAKLLGFVESDEISRFVAKGVLEELWLDPHMSIEEHLDKNNLIQNSDLDQIRMWVEKVIQENPQQVEQFRAGKGKVKAFFVGQVMKLSKGQANPKLVADAVEKGLEEA